MLQPPPKSRGNSNSNLTTNAVPRPPDRVSQNEPCVSLRDCPSCGQTGFALPVLRAARSHTVTFPRFKSGIQKVRVTPQRRYFTCSAAPLNSAQKRLLRWFGYSAQVWNSSCRFSAPISCPDFAGTSAILFVLLLSTHTGMHRGTGGAGGTGHQEPTWYFSNGSSRCIRDKKEGAIFSVDTKLHRSRNCKTVS